jgi:hypothetical protein
MSTKSKTAPAKIAKATQTKTAKTAVRKTSSKATLFVVEALGKIKSRNAKNISNNNLVVYDRLNPQTGATAYSAPLVVTQKVKDSARSLFSKANNISLNRTNVCRVGYYRSKISVK